MSDEDITIRVVKFPMLDTGIGREAGFKDDAELIRVAKAEREALPKWQQELHRDLDERLDCQMLFGDGA